MVLSRPVVRAADLDRVVLLVEESMQKLKAKSPWVWHYLTYGASHPSSRRSPRENPRLSDQPVQGEARGMI